MSGVTITIEARGTEAVQQALNRLAAQLAGPAMRHVYDEIGASLVTSTQRRFERETGPDGQRWQPLAPSTRDRLIGAPRGDGRRRRGGTRRGAQTILRVSGLLYSSLTHIASEADVVVGTNREYAALHQFGGTPDMAPGPAAVPARPFLGLDAADEAEILDIVANTLAGSVG